MPILIFVLPTAHGMYAWWFRRRCNIDRLLDENTLGSFGNQSTTCEWSADSQAAVVFYDGVYDPLVTDMNITLAGG